MTVAPSVPDKRSPEPEAAGRGRSFRLPDGSLVSLDSPGLDASRPWNCLFVARVLGTREGFTVAPRNGHRAEALRLTGVTVHPYRGAELVLGYDAARGEMMAWWRGPWHELVNARTSPRVGPERFIRIFDSLRITDTREGLLVAPRSTASFEPFTVFKTIPGYGDLCIQRPHEAEVPAPAWRGAPARHGELWRRSLPDDGEVKRARSDELVLATATAVTRLVANPGDTSDESAATDFLTALNVTWSPS